MMSSVRRVVVVSRPGTVEQVEQLLGSLTGITARLAPSLDGLAWAETDCVWLHDVPLTSPQLHAWLSAGGRLLATLDAVRVATELGVESVPPDDLRDSLWDPEPGEPAPRGLAGFGPHPLFEGLVGGACTWIPRPGAPYRWAVHLATRPAGAGIVAVERVALSLDPSRIVAWEYAVGDGGLLCIGSGIYPDSPSPACAPQLRTILGNALAGQGIPHRDRLGAPRYWPAPAVEVRRDDLAVVPELPDLAGDWPETASPLVSQPAAGSPGRWRLTGRRASLVCTGDRGLREIWIHPHAVLRDASVSVRGASPQEVVTRVTPAEASQEWMADGAGVRERWMVALEHPVVYWEVNAGGDGGVHLEWTTDLRRAWPYAAGCGGDLLLTVAPGGRRAVLGAVGEEFQLVLDVEGGTLEAAPLEGPAVRFSLRGSGRCRIRFTGVAEPSDLQRSREMLARRGFAGLRKQRGDHERELAAYATSIEAPDDALVQAFGWAKVRMDGALTGTPGLGRGLAIAPGGDDRPGGAWYSGPDACLGAMAQLAVGDRGSPRDTLKFLALTQDVDGRIAEGCSTGGLARYGTSPAVPLYLLLAAQYAAWTGELDSLARRWTGIRRAYELGLATLPWAADRDVAAVWARAMEALQPLAEALGHPEAAEELSLAGAEARSVAGSATFLPGPAALRDFDEGRFEEGFGRWRECANGSDGAGSDLLRAAEVASLAVEGLWGVRPNALESAVRVAPWLPPDWDAMAIERLRVGRTVLTVRLRRRFGQVAARVERVHGPRIHVEFQLQGSFANTPVQVDDVELQGGRVAFEADGIHALAWHS